MNPIPEPEDNPLREVGCPDQLRWAVTRERPEAEAEDAPVNWSAVGVWALLALLMSGFALALFELVRAAHGRGW